MTITDITRRALLGGLASSAVPAVAVANQEPESPQDRVERLAFELADALNDYRGRKWHVEIHPSALMDLPVAFKVTGSGPRTPQEKLDHAVAAAKKALFDLYGQAPMETTRLMKSFGVVALSVAPHEGATLKWFIDDGSPLLPEDAGDWHRSYGVKS